MPEHPVPADPTPADSTPEQPAVADTTPEVAAPQQTDSAFLPVSVPDAGYTSAGVPTLDGVREKIESRIGTALGATELAAETPEGRTATQQFEARQKAAEEKLAEIRASMHKPDQD